MNPAMSNVGAEKKKHRCLACCIVCLVFLLVMIGAAIGGSAFAFNKFVSPMIGGVDFFSAMRLVGGLYSGELNRKKIVTNAYTEEDLDDFYAQLNMHLFQQVRSKADLTEEYAAMSDDDKAAVLTELKANRKWNAKYEAAKDADKAGVVQSYYVSANLYPITIAKMTSALNLDSLIGNTSTEHAEDLEAYLSTEPLERAQVAAAGEGEEGAAEGAVEEGEGSGEGLADTLQGLLSGLHFDFKTNGLLTQFDHTQTEDYAANVKSVTFEITGGQIAAVVAEVVSSAMSALDLNNLAGGASDMGLDFSQVYLPDYVLIPQVVIEHKTELPQNPTEAQLAEYNKNTYASVTLELRIRSLLNNDSLKEGVRNSFGEMVPYPWLVDVGWSVVRGLLPKTLFITAGIYPLDPDREVFLKINNYSEKSQKDLATIINTVAGGAMFDSETVGTESAAASQSPSLMQQVNGKVVDLFSSLNEKGIPLTFVNESDGKSVGLRLAHVQMLLQFMNAYDPTGENGITPYLFMTVLKCLFSTPTIAAADLPTDADRAALYQEIEDKYGIAADFWSDGGLLNVNKLGNITSSINVKDVELKSNDQMQVNMLDKQLLSVFLRAKEDGSLDNIIGGSSSVAAAGEGEEEGTSINSLINGLNLSLMKIKQVGATNVYSLSVRASLSISNLLGNFLQDNQSILNTMMDAIPDSLSAGVTIYIHTAPEVVGKDDLGNDVLLGRVTYVGADEDGNYDTAYLINGFDETYTKRVIQTITTLMRCMSGGEGGYSLDGITEKVNSAFQKVFDLIKDNLNCSIGVKDGALVLPSLYEVIKGFGDQRVDNNETLSDADRMTIDEIRTVLGTMYHSTYAPATYTGNPGDDMLADLQSKYYLAEQWTATELFGGEVDLSSKINADSINFRDPVVRDPDTHQPVIDPATGKPTPIIKDGENVKGLYHDDRTLDELQVAIDGDALADLLTKSGKLDSLTGEGESGLLKSLSVVNCTYTVENGATYANFIFRARLTDEEAAAAGDEGDSSGFNMSDLLPDYAYLTATILLYRADGDYSAAERYSTDVVLNNNGSATNSLFKLVKVFSGAEFDRSKVTDQVKSAVRESFDKIEENVNFAYGSTAETAMCLETVFNTINKISNKPSAAQQADPDFMATYVPYESDHADDQALMDQMREFGRDPASRADEVTLADGVTTQMLTFEVDVTDYSTVFNINLMNPPPTLDDEATFYDALNSHYYITDDNKKVDTATLKSGDLVVDDTFIDLHALYSDTTDYDDLITYAYDKQLASIINSMYVDGIAVQNGEGEANRVGTAFILAVHMTEQSVQTFVKMDINPAYANANILPEVIYLVSYTLLVDPSDGHGNLLLDGMGNPLYVDENGLPFVDEDGNPRPQYYTSVKINNMTDGQTNDLFARLNKLSASMSLNFSLTMSMITEPVQNNIQDVFDTKLNTMGNVKYHLGSIEFPTLFSYLTDGKMIKDGSSTSYDKTRYMVDVAFADAAEEETYYTTHTADTDLNKTSPETLMYRMRELGKATSVADYGNKMYVWSSGVPTTSGARYNTNTFTVYDEEDFYDQLQAYYFFQGKDETRPSSAWFQEGATNIFTNLTGADFATTFNLEGYAHYTQDNNFDTTSPMYQYAAAGLYNYNGTQYGARLTDKAMGSLMKTLGGDVLNITASNISSIEVTSVELGWDYDNQNLTIRITVLVGVDTATAKALPSSFYMTTETVRHSVAGLAPTYNTKMTLNGFAMDSTFVDKDGDLAKFLNNLAHIDVLNIKDQLDTDAICNNVTEAIRKLLDEKLVDYIVPFELYTGDVDGYVEFYNIYHQIVNKLNINRTLFANADADVEHVIYKLRNYDTVIDNCNQPDGTEVVLTYDVDGNPTSNPLAIRSIVTTDRAFANAVETYVHSIKTYIDDAKSIFFVDDAGDAVYDAWEDIFTAARADGTFAFAAGDTYVLATVRIDIADAGVEASMGLLPQYIYASVVVKIDTVNSVVVTMLNDFNYEETELMKSMVSNSTNMDVETEILAVVSANLSGVTFSQADFIHSDCVGYAAKTI